MLINNVENACMHACLSYQTASNLFNFFFLKVRLYFYELLISISKVIFYCCWAIQSENHIMKYHMDWACFLPSSFFRVNEVCRNSSKWVLSYISINIISSFCFHAILHICLYNTILKKKQVCLSIRSFYQAA